MVEFSKFLPSLVDVAIGVSSSLWFLTIVTVPWDLYFKTKETRAKVDSAEEKQELKTWENGLLGLAISAHIVSALAAYGIAVVSSEQILKKRTSLVFLLSGLIRPIDAYQQYVGSRLLHLNTKVPRLEDKTEILRQEIYQTQNLVYLQDSNLSNVENSGKGNKFDRLEREIENVHSKGEQLVANIKNEESILKTLAEATTKNILEMREKTIKN
jgi:hypothetical protein